MSKSKNGSGGRDGRKNNVPPEKGKIRPGEVRNRWGASGKPKTVPPSSMDDLLWEEAGRIVSHDGEGPVDAKRRLVQEEFLAAFKEGDSVVRARLLAQLHETSSRLDQQKRNFLEFFVEGKAYLSEQFYLAQKSGRPPPDVLPHPDHVEIIDGQVHFCGPTDKRGRAACELIKTNIRVAACLHDIIRAEAKRTGCPIVFAELREIERHRRWLMRKVPRGWNWREEIYCRDSSLDFAKQTVRDLKEIGYVAPDNLN